MAKIGEEREEFDLDASMREELDRINGVEPPEDEIGGESAQEKADRIRDEKGRFAKKEETDEPAEDEVEEQEEVPETDSVQDVGEEGADAGITPEASERAGEDVPDLVNPPSSWTAAAKAKWNEVPEWARAEVHKREGEMLKGVSMLKEKSSFGERIDSIIRPYEPLIHAEGATPEVVVQEMLNTAYILRQSPTMTKVQETIRTAQRFGYLNELVATITNQRQNTPQNPVMQAVAPLQQEVYQLKQMLAQQQQQGQQAEQQAALSEVEHFAKAKSEDGKFKHPHFEQVRGMMATLIETGQAADFESAYETAIWSIPDIREVMLAQQAGSKSTKAQEDAKARAARARKASTVNLPRKGTHDAGNPVKPTGSLEDTMRETLESLKQG